MSDRPPHPSDDDWGRWPEPPQRTAPGPRPQTPQPQQRPAQAPGAPPPRQVRRPSSVPIGRPATNRPRAPETQPPVDWSNLYSRPNGHQTLNTYPPRNRTPAPGSPQLDVPTSDWDAVRQPAPGYPPPTSLPPDYPDQRYRTGELPAVEAQDGLSPDWPPPSWPEYQASLAYGDDLEDPEPKRRRKMPILLGLMLLVAGGAAGGAFWLNRGSDVEVSDTSAGRGEASSAVAESTTAPTTDPDMTTTTDESVNSAAGSSDDPTDEAGGTDGGETTDTSAPAEGEAGSGDGGGADGGGSDGGSGGSGGAAGSPTDAIEAMFAATNASDCPALIDSLSTSSREMFGSTRDNQISQCEQTMGLAPPTDMAIQSSSITSETASEATVSVTYTENGQSTTEDFNTVLEDAGWKVDLAAGM